MIINIKQNKIKTESRIKLNYIIYNILRKSIFIYSNLVYSFLTDLVLTVYNIVQCKRPGVSHTNHKTC